MKKIQLFAAIAMIAFTTNSFAQEGAATTSTEGSAAVSIVTPIAISQTTPLNFGTIAVNGQAGTYILGHDNSISTTGGVQDMDQTNVTPAVFEVTGQEGQTYSVTFPTSVSLDSPDGPSTTLSVINFVTSLGETNQGTINTEASTFNVGATLDVTGAAIEGSYSATYTVTAQYL